MWEKSPLQSYYKHILLFPKRSHFWKFSSKALVLNTGSSFAKLSKSAQPFQSSSDEALQSHLMRLPGLPLIPPHSSVRIVTYFYSAFSLHGSLVDAKASLKMPGRNERLQLQPPMLQSPQRQLFLRRRTGEPCWTCSSCSRVPRPLHSHERLRCLRWVSNLFHWTQRTLCFSWWFEEKYHLNLPGKIQTRSDYCKLRVNCLHDPWSPHSHASLMP